MSFTPRRIAQQNAERRLRHAVWAAEPDRMWLWLCAALFSPFAAALVSWAGGQ